MKTKQLISMWVKHYEEVEFYPVVKNEFNFDTIYMLDDGKYLQCESYDGQRGGDHREIFSVLDINYYQGDTFKHWEDMHKETRVGRVVPEEKVVLFDKKQTPTKKQIYACKKANLEIMYY